jgi:hypothetical protein
MSTYTPGTKLSYANGTECCTVLTEGNALVTKVWGQDHWEQMWLADWLILADGGEQEDYIPLPPDNTVQQEDFDDLPPLVPLNDLQVNEFWTELGRRSAEFEAQRQASRSMRPMRPIGTKLKWILDDQTYRVAIVTKDGICQVKAITEGGADCYYDNTTGKRYLTKRTFDSEASWIETLPQGGQIYVY